MRIVDIRERSIPISRYQDPAIPSGGLTTSIVAVITDVVRGGIPVTGYGFSSIGRFAQSGLIQERFAPRLLAASERDVASETGNLDPTRAWGVMMAGEKPGGHGERCVAVGTIDMAVWDAAAKIAGVPLYHLLSEQMGEKNFERPQVPVYAGGGYYYPADDLARLSDEIRQLRDLGYVLTKIKIGGAPLARDLKRIETATRQLDKPSHLAVDAMNSYGASSSIEAANALAPLGLWWFEDICDPLDFENLAAVASRYPEPIAAGEALFSVAEAMLLDRYGGLRRHQDVLLFDPVHCYGLTGYLRIIDVLEARGWPRTSFWPHGGHLFCLHVAAALHLGGAEVNPICFQPFGGYGDHMLVANGTIQPPDVPGIGFELKQSLREMFKRLAGT